MNVFGNGQSRKQALSPEPSRVRESFQALLLVTSSVPDVNQQAEFKGMMPTFPWRTLSWTVSATGAGQKAVQATKINQRLSVPGKGAGDCKALSHPPPGCRCLTITFPFTKQDCIPRKQQRLLKYFTKLIMKRGHTKQINFKPKHYTLHNWTSLNNFWQTDRKANTLLISLSATASMNKTKQKLIPN